MPPRGRILPGDFLFGERLFLWWEILHRRGEKSDSGSWAKRRHFTGSRRICKDEWKIDNGSGCASQTRCSSSLGQFSPFSRITWGKSVVKMLLGSSFVAELPWNSFAQDPGCWHSSTIGLVVWLLLFTTGETRSYSDCEGKYSTIQYAIQSKKKQKNNLWKWQFLPLTPHEGTIEPYPTSISDFPPQHLVLILHFIQVTHGRGSLISWAMFGGDGKASHLDGLPCWSEWPCLRSCSRLSQQVVEARWDMCCKLPSWANCLRSGHDNEFVIPSSRGKVIR